MRVFGLEIKRFSSQIKALEEGQKQDALTAAGFFSTSQSINKNNYASYQKMVDTTNRMYNNDFDYGGELLGGIADTRVSFIAGEGANVVSKDKKLLKQTTDFLNFNKLLGSNLLKAVLIGELEGKCLFLLSPNKKKQKIEVKLISYHQTNYKINPETDYLYSYDDVSLSLKDKDGKVQDKKYKGNEFVYVKLGGTFDKLNITPSKINVLLTDIENLSRAKYDMRHNNHLFGRVEPNFECKDNAEAKAVKAAIEGQHFRIGDSYIGTAKQYYLEPTGNAIKCLTDEIVILIKIISSRTGIPVHWLAWPELLSNRATAENLQEVINAATIQERLIWEECLKDLVVKAQIMAQENGFEAIYDEDNFSIKIPFISLANIKQMQETWIPLKEAKLVSQETTRGKIPGIDPNEEKKLIEKEAEEALKNNPLNKVFNGGLEDEIHGERIEESEKQDENNKKSGGAGFSNNAGFNKGNRNQKQKI